MGNASQNGPHSRGRLDLRTDDRSADPFSTHSRNAPNSSVNTNRRKRKLLADQTLQNVFPEPPGDELRSAFRKHVATTGQPETFPLVSTCQPPKDGTVIVLEHPVDINRKTRLDKGMAPCPICSPDHGKYLNGGSLIWCEATQAIYAIGPRCSAHLWEDGRMARAINLFNETERARADGVKLKTHMQRIPVYLDWVDMNRALATEVALAHSSFTHQLRRVRAVLSRTLRSSGGVALDRQKAGDVALGRVTGAGFLSGTWNIGADLDQAVASFQTFPDLKGDDLRAYIEDLAPSVRAQRCKQLIQARDALKRTKERIETAREFLSPGNVEILGRWSRSDSSPIQFSISTTATRITVRHGDAMWQGPALLPSPKGRLEPIPGWTMADSIEFGSMVD